MIIASQLARPKLLPCPFCKGKAEYRHACSSSRNVICTGCGVMTAPQRLPNFMPNGLKTMKQVWAYLDRKAGLLWNTRA